MRSSISQNTKNRPIIKRPMTKSSLLRNSAPVRVVQTSPIISKSSHTSGKSTSFFSKRPTSSMRNPSYMNDSELIELRDRLFENPDFNSVNNETLMKLQAHLREYKQDRALSEDYDNAEKASNLIELVKLELSKRQSNIESSNANSVASTSRSESKDTGQADESSQKDADDSNLFNDDQEKSKLKEFEEKWQNKFKDFYQITDQKLQELETRQSSQIDEFEKVWSTEKPQKYRKPSAKLLQLKKIERSLALSGDFEQARKIHSEAEGLAVKEQKALQEMLIRDYRAAKSTFLAKQKKEKEKLVAARQQTRDAMETQKNTEYSKFVKRSAVVLEKSKLAHRAVNKERSGLIRQDYGMSISNFNQNKVKFAENIIPPLFPPNDPSFVKEDEKRSREKRRKQLELQKKNAEIALLDYTLQPSPRDQENGSGRENEEKISNQTNSKAQETKTENSENASLSDNENTNLNSKENTNLNDNENTNLNDNENANLNDNENTNLNDNENANLNNNENTNLNNNESMICNKESEIIENKENFLSQQKKSPNNEHFGTSGASNNGGAFDNKNEDNKNENKGGFDQFVSIFNSSISANDVSDQNK